MKHLKEVKQKQKGEGSEKGERLRSVTDAAFQMGAHDKALLRERRNLVVAGAPSPGRNKVISWALLQELAV